MLLIRLSSLITLTSLSLSFFPGLTSAEPSDASGSSSTNPLNGSKHRYESHATTGDLVCRPFGECEPCPVDELHRPYCHPYGNRRLVHCVPQSYLDSESNSAVDPDSEHSTDDADNPLKHDHRYPDSSPGQNAPHVIGNQDGRVDVGGENGGAGKGGEIPAWASCGKVVALERAEYGEFVTTNTLFLIVSLFILMLRANKLAAVQYRALAAKIGIGGSVV